MDSVTDPFALDGQENETDTGETGRRILSNALALFLEFGLKRTSMDDVARRAGVGRVTVYRHYGDKDALFQAVVLRECRRAMRDIQSQLEAVASAEDYFVESFVLVVNGVRRHPLIQRLLQTEPEWLLPHITLRFEPVFRLALGYARYYFEQHLDEGYFQGLDLDFAGELLVRLVQSSVLSPGFMLAPERDEDLRRAARMLVGMLLQASAGRSNIHL